MPRLDLLSRRNLLALGAALALPAGCVVPARIRDVSFDAIGPDRVLLLGRIRLIILDFDRTGDAFIRTNIGEDEVLLPPEGEVAWIVPHPHNDDLRLARLESAGMTLRWTRGPVLAPGAVREAIMYFGTIHMALNRGMLNNRGGEGIGELATDLTDDRAAAMAAFVAQNPQLAGRRYYHVLRGTVLEAPRPRG
jgi:hypothetical protein